MEKKELETILSLVREIDPELKFIRYVGEGAYSLIFLVEKKGENYALKINKDHENFQLDPLFTLEHETQVLIDLADVQNVPKLYKFYKNAPSVNNRIKKGKNAMLITYIPGISLFRAGNQNITFFLKVKDIIDEINKRGYGIPISDFNEHNIIVDNRGNPWLIDFMCAIPLNENKRIAERQITLGNKKLNRIVKIFED